MFRRQKNKKPDEMSGFCLHSCLQTGAVEIQSGLSDRVTSSFARYVFDLPVGNPDIIQITLVEIVEFVRDRACIGPTANSNENTGQEHVEPPWFKNKNASLRVFRFWSARSSLRFLQCNMIPSAIYLNRQRLHIIYSKTSQLNGFNCDT
ncbi:hypothetical protein TH468_09045 [Thalassospira sp. MCCC 1A03138]|nr:hypothetical protein TH468_09045 [Thalassospira sp. MCCC 1A03138]